MARYAQIAGSPFRDYARAAILFIGNLNLQGKNAVFDFAVVDEAQDTDDIS